MRGGPSLQSQEPSPKAMGGPLPYRALHHHVLALCQLPLSRVRLSESFRCQELSYETSTQALYCQ